MDWIDKVGIHGLATTRSFRSKYPGWCVFCDSLIQPGDLIEGWIAPLKRKQHWVHSTCARERGVDRFVGKRP